MATIPTNTIEIKGESYMRTFDLNMSGNNSSHEQLPPAETEENATVKQLLTVNYPHGHLSLQKPTAPIKDCVIIQNTIVIPVLPKKRKQKRAIFHLDFNGKHEERWFEDGTHLYVPQGGNFGCAPYCKLTIKDGDDEHQDYSVTFNGTRQKPIAQSALVGANCSTSCMPPPSTTPESPVNKTEKAEQSTAQLPRFERISALTDERLSEEKEREREREKDKKRNKGSSNGGGK